MLAFDVYVSVWCCDSYVVRVCGQLRGMQYQIVLNIIFQPEIN